MILKQIKSPAVWRGDLLHYEESGLDRSFDLAGSHASCADFCSSDCSVVIDTYSLDVCVPFSLAVSVGMADLITGNLSFAANFTSS